MSNQYDNALEQQRFFIDQTTIYSAALLNQSLAGTAGTSSLWATAAVSSSAFADDYSADIATTGIVEVGGSVTGHIDSSNDQDWFRIDLTVGRIYAFDLMGSASGGTLSTSMLRLLNDLGTFIIAGSFQGTSEAHILYSPPISGIFYLSTLGVDSTGTYTLATTDLGGDDYFGSNATTGMLTVAGTTTGDIQFIGDQDWFSIELSEGRIYIIDMQGVDSSGGTLPRPVLYLRDSAGNIVVSDIGSGTGEDARISLSPASNGTYYLSASSNYDTLGTYTLQAADIGADDYLGSSATSGTLTLDVAVTGNIQFIGDQDWFRVELSAGQIYQFDLKGAATVNGTLPEPKLRLLDGAANFVTYSFYNWNSTDAVLTYSPLIEGTFFLSAEAAYNTSGTYTLVATLLGTDDYVGSLATSGALMVGDSTTGNIQYSGDQDWVRIDLSAGHIYSFDLLGAFSGSGTLASPYLRMFDSAGDFLVAGTDNELGFGSQLVYSPLNNETFYLSAGESFGPGGTYTLATADIGIDDYLGGGVTSGALAVGGSSNGNIQYSGDQDWFRIDLNAGVIYKFDMKGVDSAGGTLPAPFLALRNSAGEVLWSDFESGSGTDALIYFSPDSGGTYYLTAYGRPQTGGTYTLQATDIGTDDYAGSINTAGSLAMGSTATGEFQFNSDQDWFRIDLIAGHFYSFDMQGADSAGGTLPDPSLQLLDSAGRFVFYDLDSGPGKDARLGYFATTSGAYYLSAMGSGNSGSYTLIANDLGVDDYDASIATTGNLLPGDSVTGVIQLADESDWFRIELDAGRIYTFDLRGADSGGGTLAAPDLRLLDNAGNFLLWGSDSGIGRDAQLTIQATTSGTYYLDVQSSPGTPTGSYTLAATDLGTDDHADSTATLSSLAPGASVTGNIQYYDDQDWFSINLTAGTEYIFGLEGAESDGGTLSSGSLRLLDSSGDDLASDATHLFYTPAASGTYYLATQGMGTLGTYTLSADFDDFMAGVSTTGTLAPGESISGTIQGGTDRDWVKITLNAGNSYAFSVEGRDSGAGTFSDPLLRLLNSSGNEIVYNDGGGFGRDSHLTYIPTTSGTYYLSSESQSSYPDSLGTYTLSARDLGSGYSATPVSNAVALSGTATLDGLIQGSAWQFSGARVLTYSFNDVLDEGANLGEPWNDTQKDAIREALHAWETVANISFVEIAGSATIEDNTASLAFGHVGSFLDPAAGLGLFPSPTYANQFLLETNYSRADYPRLEGDVLLNDYASEMQYLYPGNSGYWVGLHEIGHALGLKHPFDDGANGRPLFIDLGIGAKDISVQTAMSYDTPASTLTNGYAATPMLLDIQAIQRIYGANTSYHNTDNTYFINDDGTQRTLWDTGGNDWLDASGLSTGIQLSLEAGSLNIIGSQSTFITVTAGANTLANGASVAASLGAGGIGTNSNLGTVLAIATGVSIENARGSARGDALTGNSGANILDGGAGNDLLNGGLGQDTLIGGLGDDSYVVDNIGDQIVETNGDGSGNDRVQAILSWTLGANLENLLLLGAQPYSGKGNGLGNTLTGNDADNILDGGSGADTLIGDVGNDTYVVDNASDVIQENPTNPMEIDTVRARVDWTLGDNLENLILLGTKSLNGTGNALNNTLTGNGSSNILNGGSGNDTLAGGSGNDTLIGGTGSDTFAFTTPLNAARNVDTIADFTSGADKIFLSHAVFSQIGFTGSPGTATFFHAGSAAHDADDRILYDPGTGTLSYDADGTGALAAVQFAMLSTAPSLLYTDLFVG